MGQPTPSVAGADDAGPGGGAVRLTRAPAVRLGPLAIEPAARRVLHDDGRERILEPRVMQVLIALARAGGAIVTRETLFDDCWDGVIVGEDALNRVITRLRRLIEELGDGALALETITKVGYRLVGGETPAPARSPARAQSGRPEARASICVLPFANMSDDAQQAYFSDGVSEDIITDLSKVSTLRVTPRAVAFTLRDAAGDIPELARRLSASHVLTGSVRKAGGRVRITAQLVDADGAHVWAERYDGELTDIFALQDEISQAIVKALRVTLLPEEKRAIARRGTASVEAYTLFLLAHATYLDGRDGEVRCVEAVGRLCRRAVDIDPGYAAAWALLGIAQNVLHFIHARPGADGGEAIDRALALDPSLPDAHAYKARRLWQEGRHEEAEAEINQALALDPESWEGHAEAGRLFFITGRYREAAAHFERGVAYSDRAVGDAGMLMCAYRALGDQARVRAVAPIVVERAERALERDALHGVAYGFGVSALAACGQAGRARDWIERALLLDPDNLSMRYNFACTAARWLDDAPLAMDLLEPGLGRMGSAFLKYVRADADLESLRGDPRFESMVTQAERRAGAA